MSISTKVRDWMWRLKQSPRAQMMLVVLLLVIIGTIIGVSFAFHSKKTVSQNLTPNQTTGLIRRLLDGVLVDSQAEATLVPSAVMIENYSLIRPQKGLAEASVVYEALAEGGITRCMAVFNGPEHLSAIGPVRSAREYFVDWADEYRGVYMHAGGSPQALAKLASDTNIVDLNQIGGDQVYFWREPSLEAPHNLFTSSEKIAYAIRDYLGETPVASFESWVFKADEKKDQRPTGEHHLQIDFSSDSYAVDWAYDRKTNTYARSNGGEAQVDALNDHSLIAHDVIVQFVPTSLIDQATGRLEMKTVGSGRSVVFEDGQKIEGTWKKETDQSRTRFYAADGQEIQLNAGTIWVEIVPDDRDITTT